MVNRVPFDINFRDDAVTIQFDPLLPRIVELAEGASARSTKVAAWYVHMFVACCVFVVGGGWHDPKYEFIAVFVRCVLRQPRAHWTAHSELLHSLVLLMVGRNAHAKTPLELSSLYAHLFPALLRLAVDVDYVTRQLFEPLVLQLVHWFARGGAVNELGGELAEAATLLTATIDALGHATDGALRDFGALCLTEFLRWSIKQATTKALQRNPVHAKSLFKRYVPTTARGLKHRS